MPKQATKNYDFLSIRMDHNAFEKLKKICKESGLSKTAAVERAVEKYYETYKKSGKV